MIGAILNVAGVPGLVKDCDYEVGITDATVKVRVRDSFTIIEVSGLEIYFNRLTGKIDGVGTMCGCTQVSAPQSMPFLSPFEHTRQERAQRYTE